MSGTGGHRHAHVVSPAGGRMPQSNRFVQTLESRNYFDAGGLDQSFGGGNSVQFDEPNGAEHVHALTTYPDGAVLAGGDFQAIDNLGMPASAGSGMLLARFRTDGSPDTSFGNGGVLVGTPRGVTRVSDLAVAADSSFYLLGQDRILHLSRTGKLDTSF